MLTRIIEAALKVHWKGIFSRRLRVLVVVLAIGGLSYPLYGPWLKDKIDNLHNTKGVIIVDSPEIYTRERLVNDRIQQALWLQKQLEITKEELSKRPFVAVDGEFTSVTDTSFSFEGFGQTGPQEEGGSGQKTLPKDNSSIQRDNNGQTNNDKKEETKRPSSLSTLERFRAINGFRNEVRAEMMQTQLDDRHDILGNTIYRLTFDTTLITGRRSQDFAVVKVELFHDPLNDKREALLGRLTPEEREEFNRKLNGIYQGDYRSLYKDWRQHLQDLLTQNVVNLTSSLTQGKMAPHERVDLDEFLRAETCKKIEYLFRGSSDDPKYLRDCESGRVSERAGSITDSYLEYYRFMLTYGYIVDYTNQIADLVKRNYAKHQELLEAFGEQFASELSRLHPDWSPERIKDHAASYVHTRIVPRYYQAGEICARQIREWKNEASSNSSSRGPQKFSYDLPGIEKKIDISCPRGSSTDFVSPLISLLSGLNGPGRLGKSMQSEEPKFVTTRVMGHLSTNCPQNRRLKWDEHISDIREDLDPRVRHILHNTLSNREGVCPTYRPRLPGIQCAVAAFRKNQLIELSDDVSGGITEYFDLEVRGHEIEQCAIMVDSKLESRRKNQDVRAQNQENSDPRDIIRSFITSLNRDTEVYSHGVSPKNLRQRIKTSLSNKDIVHLLLKSKAMTDRSSLETGLKFLKKNARELHMVQSQPLVIGYGSADVSPIGLDFSARPRVTKFGWFLAPRVVADPADDDFDDKKHVHEQHSLSTLISVPSWWRSALLGVKTCWIPHGELDDVLHQVDRICTDIPDNGRESKPQFHVVRLPGVESEISRKLGFEVFRQPHLNQHYRENSAHMLKVGGEGQLLFLGGRLWRSTTVTLGAQTADEIRVLPNMLGIIAKFDCVQEPADFLLHGVNRNGDAGLRGGSKTQGVEARVWTSEGVTPPMYVGLVYPPEFYSDDYSPCYENKNSQKTPQVDPDLK